jgi:DNA-binding MarR family transcriptional regulator
MFAVLMSSSDARAASLARRGLTPNDAKALWSLDVHSGRPIGDLAREWRCDPSNATFIIDRLDRFGLATRTALPTDRRVKLVVLTGAGAKTRAELEAEYNRPPPEILQLNEADLEMLDRILSKIRLRAAEDRRA